MFALDLSPSYPWPVTLSLVMGDGKAVTATFTAHFARLPQSDIDATLTAKRPEALADGYAADKALALRVLVGWGDDVRVNDTPLPYSEENRERLLNVAGVRRAVVNAWFESLNGTPKKDSAATGN